MTLPVNPPLGETVIVEVALAPGDAMLTGVPLSAKFGVCVGLVIVIATLVDCVRAPDTPVTVAV